MEKFDVVVIGAGPGGYPAAIRAAQLGASVAVVEKEVLGGTCLNWGCIPTKLLLAGSDLYATMRHAESFGIRAKSLGIDYPAMISRKDQVVAKLNSGVEQLLKSNGVRVLRGTGSFAGRGEVDVRDGDRTTRVRAAKTIIATGSTSAMPKFLPTHPRVVESRQFLDRTELPASVIVLGGGVIGCEFACLLAQLGVKTTIVELLPDILAPLDVDVRRELKRSMETDLGIHIITGQALQQIEATSRGVSGTAGTETLKADLLLAALGRRPVTDGLNLAAVGLEADQAGAIAVNEHAQTRVATIYAIGDVTGGLQLAHRATSMGVTAAEHACGQARARVETLIPSCIFTAPEIGTVGLSEQEAQAKGIEYRVGKFPFAALGKAMAIGHTGGFLKWVVDAKTDQLIGAHAVGAHATDLIGEAAVAIRSEQTAEELGRTVHAHPTMAEAWMEAAHAVHGACIHLPAKRKA